MTNTETNLPAVIEPSTELATVPSAAELGDVIATMRDPELVLEDARRAAAALMSVIRTKKEIVRFNGEQYIEADDWALIARFYGLSALLESDRFVDYGGAQGFEATVVLKDINGVERGRATSMCLNDEENWRERPKYATCFVLLDGTLTEVEPSNVWKECLLEETGKTRGDGTPVMRPKKERRLVGTEAVPLFQIRSMAQTRATGKAYAMILRFVPMLANLKSTPAEELPHAERVAQNAETHPGVNDVADVRTEQTQQQARRTGNGGNKPPNTRPCSDPQLRRMFAIAHECGVSDADVASHLRDTYNIADPTQLRRCDYDDAVRWIQSQ